MASIRERNGKFNVIYSYTNEKGERKQKWETYETKAEAKRRKKEIEYKKEMGSFVVRKCKTLDELITEYVALYGKENWALSTYEGNVSLINNYILPIIGDTKLSEINTRFIERYYQSLLKRRAVINPLNKTSRNEFVSSSTVRDINKLLRNCFEQAVKWELMEKNPCTHATVPKHKSQIKNVVDIKYNKQQPLIAFVYDNDEMNVPTLDNFINSQTDFLSKNDYVYYVAFEFCK